MSSSVDYQTCMIRGGRGRGTGRPLPQLEEYLQYVEGLEACVDVRLVPDRLDVCSVFKSQEGQRTIDGSLKDKW